MRKLLPAIAMLLLSAVLMSTASFAWFSTNDEAQVSGFNAKISAATTLLVKESTAADSTYATFITFTENKENMAPVSTDKIAVPAFYEVDNTVANTIVPGSADYKDATFKESGADNYLSKSVTFRAPGGDAAGAELGKFHVAINATQAGGAEKEINEAFRIMLIVDGTDVFYINPFGEEAVKPITGLGADDKPEVADAAVTQDLIKSTLSTGIDLLGTNQFLSEATHKVDIFMWFEGQDPSCFANNATDLKGITVDFTFSLVV